MSAWVTKEWTEGGRRRRAKAPPGVRGVKESDRFAVEWLDPEGKRCREKIAEPGRFGKNLADERCQQLNSEMTLGMYRPKAKATWAETKQRFIDDVVSRLSEGSQYEYRRALNQFERIVQPKLMEDVTDLAVDHFIGRRSLHTNPDGTRISQATVNKDIAVLRRLCRRAVKWKVLRDLPEFSTKGVDSDRPHFTESEFEALYRACETAEPSLPDGINFPRWLWWQSLLAMYWETGARRCELLSLRWEAIDLDAQCLRIAPKDNKTRRVKECSFGDWGAEHLRTLAAYGTDGAVFVWPHDVSRLNEKFNQIKKAAGIDPSRRHLAFHAIRRSVGEMTTERYGLTAAQYKLGHSTQAVTAKHYASKATRKLAQQSLMPVPAGLTKSHLRVVG